MQPQIYLLVSDVALALGVSRPGARFLEMTGQCPAAARTPSGVRLFDPATVERVRRARAQQRGEAAR